MFALLEYSKGKQKTQKIKVKETPFYLKINKNVISQGNTFGFSKVNVFLLNSPKIYKRTESDFHDLRLFFLQRTEEVQRSRKKNTLSRRV